MYALRHKMRLTTSTKVRKMVCAYKRDAPNNEKIQYGYRIQFIGQAIGQTQLHNP